MANDVADWTSSVVIQSGTVTITGTASVSIVGTASVSVAGTANVAITNVPAVTISSGTVTIANASIGVINAAGTKITSSRPPKELGFMFVDATGATNNFVLDPDVQALVLALNLPLAAAAHLKVTWHPVAPNNVGWIPLELFQFSQFVYVVPITPTMRDSGNQLLNSIDVTLVASAGQFAGLVITELFESAPEWLTLFPQPQLEPNQFPATAFLALVGGAIAKWIIPPVANVKITLFSIVVEATTNFGASNEVDIGHAAALPTPPASPGLLVELIGNTGFPPSVPNAYPFSGATLPAGEGLYIESQISNGNVAVLVIYSLS